MLGVFLVLIPFELGILFYEGKKRNGKFSLQGSLFIEKEFPSGNIYSGFPYLSLSSICFLLLSPLDSFLIKTVFSWLPAWFISSDISGYSRAIQIVTVAYTQLRMSRRP